MHESNRNRTDAPDPMATIIRAAGARAVPPEEHYDRVFAAAHGAWQGQLRRRRQQRWLALAAGVALLALTGNLLLQTTTGDAMPVADMAMAAGGVEVSLDNGNSWTQAAAAQSLAAGARLRTTAAGMASLGVRGGGSLRLAGAAEIVLGRTRFELVGGTLYFDSFGRSPAATIEIATALGTVRDIGTQFEVAAAEDALRVRIRQGSVAIARPDGGLTIEADAGTEIALPLTGSYRERRLAADDPAWDWVQTLAAAPPASESIITYLNWIQRETGKRLEFASRYVELRAETETLEGDPAGLTPMEVLALIADTTDFRYRDMGNGTLHIDREEP